MKLAHDLIIELELLSSTGKTAGLEEGEEGIERRNHRGRGRGGDN